MTTADDVLVDNGAEADYSVATDDDGTGKHVQIVKLAQSADGSRTPILADGSGLEVQAGAAFPVTDNGGSLTVDGTVAVTNAGLTELAAAIDTELQVDVVGALPAGNNNIGDVDVASSALPSGASTAAKQDTIIGHLDGVEGLLTAIDGDTGALAVVGGGLEATAQRVTLANDSTGVLSVDDNGATLSVDDGGGALTVDGTVAVTGVSTAAKQDTLIGHVDGIEGLLTTIDADTGTVAGAVAGTEVQVDVVAALPAGTNNIGDVDVLSLPALPAGANNIGDVDIASLPNEGQQTMANSISVALASNQTAVPISATSLPLPDGAAGAVIDAAVHIPDEAISRVIAVAGSDGTNVRPW